MAKLLTLRVYQRNAEKVAIVPFPGQRNGQLGEECVHRHQAGVCLAVLAHLVEDVHFALGHRMADILQHGVHMGLRQIRVEKLYFC